MSNGLKNRTFLLYLTIMLLTLLVTFFIFSSIEVIEEKKIFGLWKGENNGQELIFRFEMDGTCVLSFKDKTSASTKVLFGNFKMDLSKKPIPISITNIPSINHPLHTIVEFIGDDTIKLAEFSPRRKLRPISFDRNTFVSLNRVN